MVPKLALPIGVVTEADLGRIITEVESMDTFMQEAAIRKPGTKVTLPKISKLCEDFIEDNKLNMLNEEDRAHLLEFLHKVKEESITIHMSFNADPPAKFLQKLMSYLRENIHPHILLNVGLQPNIGGGCILRTTNKQFDFTLRKNLETKTNELVEYLQSITNHAEAAK